MLTIEEIKAEAELEASTYEFNWEQLEDPRERQYLEERLAKTTKMLPTIESLYTKLTSGKKVVLPDTDTSLTFDESEHYAMLVAEELYSAYILHNIRDRYEKVNSIIALSGSME